ncbi:MAG TPA: pyrroloquinoline quinone-dependent dehydrogenase [Humisphaera sp.]|jgi:quinoprotein glucose dehydrogenase|nr:pyrroloquinoline quinone-dependent dehydrogenase [Humisphaera sp.]
MMRFIARIICVIFFAASAALAADSVDWPNVFLDKQGTRYSTLDQINRANVTQLKVAWIYHAGDMAPGRTIECTPIVIGGVMYITTVNTNCVALDAATGKVLWRFDPYTDNAKHWLKTSGGVNRGVAYWSDGKPDGARRILLGLTDGRLISLDAKDGKPDAAFGVDGEVDLRAGLKDEYGANLDRRGYGPTSAPLVFENLVFLGFSNDEASPAAPGDTRAFDVRSGKEVWRFHAIPRGDEFAADQWKQGYKDRGGANAWGGLTLDPERGVLFFGTGSVTSDFYGADRPGDNLFANCTIALDARTGKRLWHFQTAHHDIWDHDNPCPPVLVKIKHEGKDVEAVAQCTKTGFCFLFDRVTGKPLFEVKETPVPASDLPGEQASPTQPVPVKPPPFSKQRFNEEDITELSPQAHDDALKKMRGYRHDSFASPPSERGSVVTSGFHGGATWSGASFDPTTGYLYVNSNNVPNVITMRKDQRLGYQATGYNQFLDAQGYPAIKPPWGVLTCIDLNSGEFVWQVALGEHPELTARGVPRTGTENFGGTIVTAGGLVFIAGTKDERFHAFDKSTGKMLWEYQLRAGGYATPATYMVNGKQYVVIAAGGGGKPKTKSGDEFVVFCLP